jgi:tellurite resistance protein TerC
MNRLAPILSRVRLDQVRRVVIAVIGTTVLLFGLALIILPGPAFVVIPIGLAILASEFAWARRVIRRGRIFVARARRSLKE